MRKPIASLMAVGLLLLAACGTGDKVEPGPVTSFEDIAGTYEALAYGGPLFMYLDEDGTIRVSSVRSLVEDQPHSIDETRFEGTKVFLHQTLGGCDDDPDATYEIHLLENGNLQFVLIEDMCAIRSAFDVTEFTPVP